ncbi:Rdx family-domain-containing protein [Fusarium flagelliforme]|uniref:Selenoprotein w-like protein n=1 Tax=Fusarium flagelliforme TaxID=2675880 RepID=A0A395MWD4_9HYPO|nr:Rdx family-domain-containing protein [Fusarium flagelliforme]KAH7188507.1 Rdx family-domain-containing protein [Fusarium flagelliforme]RFN52204.1 selenoprotein w-like protein [Fusarium flagelliforme]
MTSQTPLPRVSIQFCTQCKWMLRAAYYAQELLSTFSTGLGEVALQPSTGGTFIVTITHQAPGAETASTKTLWDRREDGGFPETKELKRRVRDVIEPNRDLGHVDKDYGKKKDEGKKEDAVEEKTTDTEEKKCEDCQ